MIQRFTSVRKTAILLFLALTFCYLIMTPGSTIGRGYISEEMDSGNRILLIISDWLTGQPAPEMVWSRHGPVPVLFDLPFLMIGKFVVSQDFILSLQPVLLTAGSMVVVFLWLRKVATPLMSLALALTGAFATMLWPYAYIGLETKQSLFVLLAAYLALSSGKIRRWPGLVLFAVAGGISLTVKNTGIVMWPAISYLVYVQFRDDWRKRRLQLLVVSLLIAGIWEIGDVLRKPYWGPRGGVLVNIDGWLTHSPVLVFTNFIGVFGSPVKGLAVFAPVLLLCIYGIPRVFRTSHRDLAIFSLLVMVCSAGFISLLIVPSDEGWGPRYMHVVIAPLLVCIGAAWPRLEWKIGLPLAGLAAAGFAISFLGAFSSYGVPSLAMKEAGQNTMEWINGDPVWAAPVFELRLFRAWLRPGIEPVLWTPLHHWVWEPPENFTSEWKAIDLRHYSTPQSILLQYWSEDPKGTKRITFRLSLFSMVVGPLLLLLAVFRTMKDSPKVFPQSGRVSG
jgi:hypothetical protein